MVLKHRSEVGAAVAVAPGVPVEPEGVAVGLAAGTKVPLETTLTGAEAGRGHASIGADIVAMKDPLAEIAVLDEGGGTATEGIGESGLVRAPTVVTGIDAIAAHDPAV